MGFSSKALFYTSVDRSLFLLRLDKYYRRVSGPAMLILSLEVELEIMDAEGKSHFSHSLLVPAGVPIKIKSNCSKVAIYFLKAGGADVKKLNPLMNNHFIVDKQTTLSSNVRFERELIENAKIVWKERPEVDQVLNQFERWINAFDSLYNKPIHSETDARVLKIIVLIKADCTANLPVSEMAKEARLSTSRLSQLFREATGASIRRYRLWERVFYVARCLQSGMSLTEAAVAAGFSDYGQCFRAYKDLGGCHPAKTNNKTEIRAIATNMLTVLEIS